MYGWIYCRILFPLYESGLRRRRTFEYWRQLEEQQYWPAERLRELQWRKLSELLRHAAANVPFYRERFRRADFDPARLNSPDDLRRIPFLTKEDIRANHDQLIAAGVSPNELHASGTGGSSGDPIRFAYDHVSYEWRIAAAARADRWAGWNWGRKQFYFWGVSLVPISAATRFKRRIHNRIQRLRLANVFGMTDARIEQFVNQLNRYRPDVIVGYSHALVEVARVCRERGLKPWRPRGVIATADRLFPSQRELLAQVFDCGVFDRYGCREVMNIAAECEQHRGLHLNADNLYIELERDGRPVRPGEIGEVIITDLNNLAMPFIRYRNGDLAVAAGESCPCGRGLPLLEHVEGRILEVLTTRDGRYVPGIFFGHLLKDYRGIKRFQARQAADYSVKLLLSPAGDFDRASIEPIRASLAQYFGGHTPVSVELVDDIPLTAGGKHRIIVSAVPRPEWAERAPANNE